MSTHYFILLLYGIILRIVLMDDYVSFTENGFQISQLFVLACNVIDVERVWLQLILQKLHSFSKLARFDNFLHMSINSGPHVVGYHLTSIDSIENSMNSVNATLFTLTLDTGTIFQTTDSFHHQ